MLNADLMVFCIYIASLARRHYCNRDSKKAKMFGFLFVFYYCLQSKQLYFALSYLLHQFFANM